MTCGQHTCGEAEWVDESKGHTEVTLGDGGMEEWRNEGMEDRGNEGQGEWRTGGMEDWGN